MHAQKPRFYFHDGKVEQYPLSVRDLADYLQAGADMHLADSVIYLPSFGILDVLGAIHVSQTDDCFISFVDEFCHSGTNLTEYRGIVPDIDEHIEVLAVRAAVCVGCVAQVVAEQIVAFKAYHVGIIGVPLNKELSHEDEFSLPFYKYCYLAFVHCWLALLAIKLEENRSKLLNPVRAKFANRSGLVMSLIPSTWEPVRRKIFQYSRLVLSIKKLSLEVTINWIWFSWQ